MDDNTRTHATEHGRRGRENRSSRLPQRHLCEPFQSDPPPGLSRQFVVIPFTPHRPPVDRQDTTAAAITVSAAACHRDRQSLMYGCTTQTPHGHGHIGHWRHYYSGTLYGRIDFTRTLYRLTDRPSDFITSIIIRIIIIINAVYNITIGTRPKPIQIQPTWPQARCMNVYDDVPTRIL